jgi:hypothetical protein
MKTITLSVSFADTKKRIFAHIGNFLQEYGFSVEQIFAADKTLKGFVRKEKFSNRQIIWASFYNYKKSYGNANIERVSARRFFLPTRVCFGIISAKINGNPNLQELIKLFRERLKPSKKEFQDEYENVVSEVSKENFSPCAAIDFPKLLTSPETLSFHKKESR